jgi:hypothetical protein
VVPATSEESEDQLSCREFFDPYVTWAEAAPSSLKQYVSFNLVSNEANGVCSFARGPLHYRPSVGDGTPSAMPASFEGHAPQLFSDRLSHGTDPFSREAADSIDLDIQLSDPPRVDLILLKWGGRHISFTVACQRGVLIGEAEGVTYLLSLQASAPVPA